jgi:hypothetical protein
VKILAAQVLSMDTRGGSGGLRLADGTFIPFRLEAATGFVPAVGLSVVAQLAEDGSVARLHLPAHPSKPEPLALMNLSWVSVLRGAALPEAPAELQALFGSVGVPSPRVASFPRDGAGRRRVELVWPLMHMLLTETDGALGLDTMDRRNVSPEFAAGSHTVTLLPAAVDPSEERRALGEGFADPWGDQGTLRRASRVVRALLAPAGCGLVLHRAGQLVLEREDALRRLGDLEDPDVRPFGAWVDWALTSDRSAYRTLGMPTLGGEDVEIAVTNPDAEVEVDSAESALLFACMLQVRENRFLKDGELFHVPKDVRVGARGASASSRTGYRYFAHRGHVRVQLVRG